MSALMKKLPTEIVRVGNEDFKVPRATAKAVLTLLKNSVSYDEELISSDESQTLKAIDSKFTRPGACLQGARIKEGYSQVDLAEKLKISQSNLSKMELGKRPIGKAMAKRIAAVLKIDYRLFL